MSTRIHKSATKTKKMDMHTGNNSEKSCKTKKSYKKIEVEAHFLNDPMNDEEPITKKEKKDRKQIKKQEVPKVDSKVEKNKKQNTRMKKSTKIKILKSKSS